VAVPAYLDHAATSPVRPEAVEAMLPWLTHRFGNPSGSHSVARAARCAIDEARDVMADVLGVAPGGVVFTGGGTEADNLAVAGVVGAGVMGGSTPGVIVTTAIEHEAVLRSATATGAEVRRAPVDGAGVVDVEALTALLDENVALVSVMLVNNEVGSRQPLGLVAAAARRRARRARIHTDAVQGLVWLDLRRAAAAADLISVSAHKFGGPQGVGVLAVRGDVDLRPVLHGGGQERERRSGTHNVAGIVGMAAAARATDRDRAVVVATVGRLRDRLVDGLLATVPGATETGARCHKVAGTAHLCFDGVESEALLVLLDEAGVCASSGSACASGAMEPSHVLLAMGLDETKALGSLRLTLGRTTTDADVDTALAAIPAAVARLRGA
jgi:cysteine desulfurase